MFKSGAGGWARTSNILITSEGFSTLSYPDTSYNYFIALAIEYALEPQLLFQFHLGRLLPLIEDVQRGHQRGWLDY